MNLNDFFNKIIGSEQNSIILSSSVCGITEFKSILLFDLSKILMQLIRLETLLTVEVI